MGKANLPLCHGLGGRGMSAKADADARPPLKGLSILLIEEILFRIGVALVHRGKCARAFLENAEIGSSAARPSPQGKGSIRIRVGNGVMDHGADRAGRKPVCSVTQSLSARARRWPTDTVYFSVLS